MTGSPHCFPRPVAQVSEQHLASRPDTSNATKNIGRIIVFLSPFVYLTKGQLVEFY